MFVSHSRDHKENVYGCNECLWHFNTIAGPLITARTPMMTGTLLAQLVGKSLPASLTYAGIPNPTTLNFVISVIEFLFQMISCLII